MWREFPFLRHGGRRPRCRREQPAGIVVARMPQHRFPGTVLHQAPVLHHRHPRAQALDHRQIVGDEQECRVAAANPPRVAFLLGASPVFPFRLRLQVNGHPA